MTFHVRKIGVLNLYQNQAYFLFQVQQGEQRVPDGHRCLPSVGPTGTQTQRLFPAKHWEPVWEVGLWGDVSVEQGLGRVRGRVPVCVPGGTGEHSNNYYWTPNFRSIGQQLKKLGTKNYHGAPPSLMAPAYGLFAFQDRNSRSFPSFVSSPR